MPGVPISDAGFRHGVGVFETVRVERGKAPWRAWHVESIRESAQALGLRVEEGELEKIPEGDGLWRWFVTETGTRTWWSAGLDKVPGSYSLKLARVGVWSSSWEARYKTLSYLSRIQGKREAEGMDAEVAMLNEKGELASAAMGNLFWVKGGVWRTPARECGCRAGTVRRWVLERSGKKVEEGRWGAEELDQAEEIFITNARVGIVGVGRWAGQKDKRMILSAQLAEAFRAASA
ncbi:MAG: aminotransferase class IV [Verrucomicrobia bacterium]|nr:aminotransferase class IV [Verrucomicrobiota bacterium]